jgi:GlpG protein
MRLVISLQDHEQAERFSLFLDEKKIKNRVERKPTECLIWAFNEDDIPKAKEAFAEFQLKSDWRPSPELLQEKMFEEEQSRIAEDSLDSPDFDESELEELERIEKEKKNQTTSQGFGRLTLSISLFCVFIFIWAVFSAPSKIEYPGYTLDVGMALAPPYSSLIYENPQAFQYAYQFDRAYQAAENRAAFLESPEALKQFYQFQEMPYWHGIYQTYMVPSQTFRSLNKSFALKPSFDQIKEGEVWRLVTPSLLHANLFHILFNLIWFVFLGNQIERRIGKWKLFLFLFLVAVLSNTAQYLMTGPNFLGLSGVIMGMAGFIYIRQSKAAWEGYSIQRPTLYFLAFYVLALVALQTVSFAMELAGKVSIAPNIANTGHVIGALVGLGLGSLNFFSAWNLGKIK